MMKSLANGGPLTLNTPFERIPIAPQIKTLIRFSVKTKTNILRDFFPVFQSFGPCSLYVIILEIMSMSGKIASPLKHPTTELNFVRTLPYWSWYILHALCATFAIDHFAGNHVVSCIKKNTHLFAVAVRLIITITGNNPHVRKEQRQCVQLISYRIGTYSFI